MMVDSYSLQHPDRYCASAKSLAAHLGGLCCAFEHAGDPSALGALQRWLSGAAPLVKPDLPASRGTLTIAEVCEAATPADHARAVERWARSTWEAYAPLQPLALQWIHAAMANRRAIGSRRR